MTIAFGGGAVPQIELRHRLQIAREYAGLEQGELAERMGVSRNSVSNYEHGRTTPRKIVLNAWAMACGVSIDWIRDGVAPPDGGGSHPFGGPQDGGGPVSHQPSDWGSHAA